MKIDKTGIWRGVLSLAVASLTLALGSCTKEPTGLSMPGGDGIQVRVTFAQSEVTRAVTGGTEVGTANENRLDRVTILVFSGDGTELETIFSEDVTSANTSLPTTQPKWASDQTLIVSPVITPESSKKIYAIANWSRVDFDKDTYTETMLQDEITTIASVASINNAAAYPMLMSGSKDVPNLTSLSYNVTVDMERQSSKISTQLTIPKDVQKYMTQIEWQTDLMTITVANVPNQSWIIGRNESPVGANLLNSDPITVDDTKPATGDQTLPATVDLKWSESVYITENPIVGTSQASKAASTYVIVQLPYKNRITGVIEHDNYYKIYINDTRDAASPHKVLRNTIYNFNIRVLGMGLPYNDLVADVNIEDQLIVLPWEVSNIDVEDKPQYHFNIDRTYIGFQSFETSFRSTITTDVADWKLVKADGTTVFSFAEGKTVSAPIDGITYTLGGTAAAATITVSKPIDLINFPINKMSFIAKNLNVPFTVAYDNGFIPSSVLTAAGWSADRLPARGLQIAKLGDQILPSGVTQGDDAWKQWKTSKTPTPGTAVRVGMGKRSTDAMIAAGADEHPAAKYCREMGPEWYLPSREELLLIYDYKAALGSSYTFPATTYWSASENGNLSSSSWTVSLYSGSTSSYNKTTTLKVRCVREI